MANFENLSSDFQTIAMDIYSSITQVAADPNNNNSSNLHFQTYPPFSTSLDSLFLHHLHQKHFPGKSPDSDNNNFSSSSTFIHHSNHTNVDETKKRKAMLQNLSSSENSGVSDSVNINTTETVIDLETLIFFSSY